MSDVFNNTKRSEVMKKVHSIGNKSTELRLIKIFKIASIKNWKRNYPVKGKPDFVFLQQRLAIFTDGCFWHGHDCRNTRPKANHDYWVKKRERNIRRDIEITILFKKRGWQVLRIWECELKKANEQNIINRIRKMLQS